MVMLSLRLLAAIIFAFFAGKLISKLKLPSILGWLIAGMILGPHAVSLVGQQILDATVVSDCMIHILECAVGLMIGTELVWNKIRRSGKAIVITTLTQSVGTFLFVSLVFGIIFYIQGTPLYLAFLFGGIALATAPAPALSIVREFKTKAPVTETLIPMAALDDIVGCVIFLSDNSDRCGHHLSAGELPAYMIALMVDSSAGNQCVSGGPSGRTGAEKGTEHARVTHGSSDRDDCCWPPAWASGSTIMVMPSPVLNSMLIGMAFSASVFQYGHRNSGWSRSWMCLIPSLELP